MTRLFLRVSFLSAVLIASSAATSKAAWPIVVSETVYSPTSSILTVPTSYAVPTSYFVPTSVSYSGLQTYSYRPTSYYLTESAYALPRRFYRPTTYYIPRRYVTSSLVDYSLMPTSYYVPTTISSPLITTSASSLCCDVQPACESVAPATAPTARANTGNNGSSTFNPDADNAGETPSLEDTNKVIRSTPRSAAPVAPKDSSVGSLPDLPDEPTQPAQPATPAEINPGVPTTPAPDDLLGPPPTADLQHEVQRPIYRASTARSTLRGKVVSATDGKPEKGVTVTLSDARGRFKDKTKVTGDDGSFSVVLPEGDWSVVVPSTDGKTVLERPITVSGGLITDDKDTAVSVLTLNR
jgi:hypothetical protein